MTAPQDSEREDIEEQFARFRRAVAMTEPTAVDVPCPKAAVALKAAKYASAKFRAEPPNIEFFERSPDLSCFGYWHTLWPDVIHVAANLSDEQTAYVSVHECVHKCDPSLDERAVEAKARALYRAYVREITPLPMVFPGGGSGGGGADLIARARVKCAWMNAKEE